MITGAGNGIGQQLALQLLVRGARVAAVDLRPEGLEKTAELASLRIGTGSSRLSLHVVDITDRAGTEALAEEVIATHGTVDGLINNAGIIQPFLTVVDLDYETIDRVWDVNFMGTLYMVKSFLPTLLTRDEAHIVNLSSMGGFFPFPGQTIYGASKAAVKLLSEGLYAELLDTSVHVSVVMPGAVSTSIADNSGVEVAGDPASSKIPQTSPEKAARIILDGVEKDRLHILVGKDAHVMSAAIKVAPKQATKFVRKQMKSLLPDSD